MLIKKFLKIAVFVLTVIRTQGTSLRGDERDGGGNDKKGAEHKNKRIGGKDRGSKHGGKHGGSDQPDMDTIQDKIEGIQHYLQGKGLDKTHELVLVGERESVVTDFACDCTDLHDGIGRDYEQSDFLHLGKGEPVYDNMPHVLRKDVDAVNEHVGRPEMVFNMKDTEYEQAEECNWLGNHGLGLLLTLDGIASDLNACNYGLIVYVPEEEVLYMDPENEHGGLRVYASSAALILLINEPQ